MSYFKRTGTGINDVSYMNDFSVYLNRCINGMEQINVYLDLNRQIIDEDDSPAIKFAYNLEDSIKEKTISNIKEVKARGAKVILVTNDTNIDKEIYDILIEIPKTNDLIQNMLTIVPLQVLSYEIAKLRGCHIDKPKNLAKSVTVE